MTVSPATAIGAFVDVGSVHRWTMAPVVRFSARSAPEYRVAKTRSSDTVAAPIERSGTLVSHLTPSGVDIEILDLAGRRP